MTQLPTIFDGLADLGAEHSEFELCDPADSDDSITAWLGALPSDGTRFVVFAQDGMGSLFCLWLRPGHADVETAPVVYLGSEGELGVLAKDPTAFLEFVASGMTFDGYAGTFFDSLSDETDKEFIAEAKVGRKAVAAYLKRRAGVVKLRHPDLLKAEAEAAYPGLAGWVAANNTRG